MPYRIHSQWVCATHFYQACGICIPASQKDTRKHVNGHRLKITRHNTKYYMLWTKGLILPARKVTACICWGTKEFKRDRKELIIDQTSEDWEEGHQQNNITTSKCHLHDISKFLFFFYPKSETSHIRFMLEWCKDYNEKKKNSSSKKGKLPG